MFFFAIIFFVDGGIFCGVRGMVFRVRDERFFLGFLMLRRFSLYKVMCMGFRIRVGARFVGLLSFLYRGFSGVWIGFFVDVRRAEVLGGLVLLGFLGRGRFWNRLGFFVFFWSGFFEAERRRNKVSRVWGGLGLFEIFGYIFG